jgi:hypothetical protein
MQYKILQTGCFSYFYPIFAKLLNKHLQHFNKIYVTLPVVWPVIWPVTFWKQIRKNHGKSGKKNMPEISFHQAGQHQKKM